VAEYSCRCVALWLPPPFPAYQSAHLRVSGIKKTAIAKWGSGSGAGSCQVAPRTDQSEFINIKLHIWFTFSKCLRFFLLWLPYIPYIKSKLHVIQFSNNCLQQILMFKKVFSLSRLFLIFHYIKLLFSRDGLTRFSPSGVYRQSTIIDEAPQIFLSCISNLQRCSIANLECYAR
jgi:hypothetical protein